MSTATLAKNASLVLSPSAKNDTVSFLAAVKEALAHHFAAETAARQCAAYAALCGLTLKRLKKEAGHGKWEEYHGKHFGDRLPLRMAQRYMLVAEGLKVKAKDHPALLALLRLPAHKLPPAKRETLAKMVRGITDGETMRSLIEAYRITRRPAAASLGGYHPDLKLLPAWAGEQGLPPETDYAALPPEQQATYRQWESHRQAERQDSGEQQAFDFYTPLLNDLERGRAEALWQRLPDAERFRLYHTALAIAEDLRPTLPAQQR